MTTRRALLSVLALCLIISSSSAIVPLFGWSNSDAFSGVKGDQFSSANELIYDAALDNIDVIVIFKSPELSFDSLAKYGGLYGVKNPSLSTLQSEMKSSKSSILAGVDGSVASDFISTLSFITEEKPLIVTGAEGLTQHKLIQVELLSSSDEEGALSEQDAVISEVMAAIKALPGSPSYAAIFTSSHTHMSRSDSNRNELRRSADDEIRREARQENGEGFSPLCRKYTLNGTEAEDQSQVCLAFCFTDGNITRRNASNTDSAIDLLEGITILGGSCGNDSICGQYGAPCLHFTAQVNDSLSDTVNFTFVFPKGNCDDSPGDPSIPCRFWTMELVVDEENYARGGEERKIFSAFTVPFGASYACGKNRLNEYKPSNKTNVKEGMNYVYSFKGIQAQVYSGITENRQGMAVFGPVYNCQGYLTHIPLMGLVTAIILMLILYCSVAFVFRIQTMDRFDDPRGPTISVENLH